MKVAQLWLGRNDYLDDTSSRHRHFPARDVGVGVPPLDEGEKPAVLYAGDGGKVLFPRSRGRGGSASDSVI